MFLGLRTALYHAPDLAKAKAWYSSALKLQPHFDEPFYVGYNVGGYELGLDPDAKSTPGGPAGVVAYWGVENVDTVLAHLLGLGATLHSKVQEVGGGIRVASVTDPFGNIFGIIENPHFVLPLAKKKKKPTRVKRPKPTPAKRPKPTRAKRSKK